MAASRRFALPIFLNKKNKVVTIVVGLFIGSVLYLASNHYHLFTPVVLPMTWIDRAIPFLPHTVWIYLSEYFLFGAVYFMSQDLVNTNKYVYSMLFLQLMSAVIFWLWPTTFPRENFPLPADLDPLTRYIFSSLREADSPANCCPSLHVSSVYLSSFVYLDEQRKKFPFFFLWATAVAISTFTTKQHYLVDVVSGFVLAAVFYVVFHRWVPYRILKSAGAHAKR